MIEKMLIKEIKKVIKDGKVMGKLITKVQEILEEMGGINIMLTEYAYETLKKVKVYNKYKKNGGDKE